MQLNWKLPKKPGAAGRVIPIIVMTRTTKELSNESSRFWKKYRLYIARAESTQINRDKKSVYTSLFGLDIILNPSIKVSINFSTFILNFCENLLRKRPRNLRTKCVLKYRRKIKHTMITKVNKKLYPAFISQSGRFELNVTTSKIKSMVKASNALSTKMVPRAALNGIWLFRVSK